MKIEHSMRPRAVFTGETVDDLPETRPFGQTRRMSFRARSLRILLALLLCFSQQQAVLHLLGHDLARVARTDALDPQEAACAKCLAIAHLDHAIVADVPTPAVVRSSPLRTARVPAHAFEPAFVARYRSRAPPVSA